MGAPSLRVFAQEPALSEAEGVGFHESIQQVLAFDFGFAFGFDFAWF
jgi:hypothetical protein